MLTRSSAKHCPLDPVTTWLLKRAAEQFALTNTRESHLICSFVYTCTAAARRSIGCDAVAQSIGVIREFILRATSGRSGLVTGHQAEHIGVE